MVQRMLMVNDYWGHCDDYIIVTKLGGFMRFKHLSVAFVEDLLLNFLSGLEMLHNRS